MSFTLMRTTVRSPCQPTASSGLNGYVMVEIAPRRFTFTCHAALSLCCARNASSMLRHVQHRRIEDGVRPDEAFLRQV